MAQTPVSLADFTPLDAIAIPNVGRLQPRGLIVVLGPNSSGKTQFLRDIQARLLGKPRQPVVCSEIVVKRPDELDRLLATLYETGHIQKRLDEHNNSYIHSRMPPLGTRDQSHWQLTEGDVANFFRSSVDTNEHTDRFLQYFGRFFVSSLFLDRRLELTNTVASFDYERDAPAGELQALYINREAKASLTAEAIKVFGKAIWLDNTRQNKLCLRVANDAHVPSAEQRLEPEDMKKYRLIEDEGDGFKSYMGICVTLLLGQRPICLIDEPEMCLHPPQAYALGQFIARHGQSQEHATFVATHSSHILRGIVDEARQLELVRLSRVGVAFSGEKVSQEAVVACIEKPSTKIETILDGLFAEAVTVVEAEGDRLVYSTTFEKLAGEFEHDVHFVSVGGVGGIADTCRLYRGLKVPLCVIADLDLMSKQDTFERVLHQLASTDVIDEMVADSRALCARVESLGPIVPAADVRRALDSLFKTELDWTDKIAVAALRRKLSDLNGDLSPSVRLKRGIDQIGAITHDMKAYLQRCRRIGLFLVPCGELESWIPALMADGPSKNRKAEWANAAANKIRCSPAQADDIWQFIRQMATCQRDEASRLSGYPT